MLARPIARRTFLRAAGVCIGLPLLEAMHVRADAPAKPIKRLVLVGRPLGFHAPHFFPTKTGADYEATRYLKPFVELRKDFTVFSGMSHRGYPGGHNTLTGLMTGVAAEGMRFNDLRNTISLDQFVAPKLGTDTRFASLVLGGGELAWNAKGVRIPSEERATQAFKQLFIQGTPQEIEQQIKKIEHGQSILDGVREQAKTLQQSLGANDQRRVDLLLTSIREAEQRLQQDQAWVRKPKPKVTMTPPTSDYIAALAMLERTRQWFDIVHLALQTDSTRVVSLFLWSHEGVNLPGVTMTHHDASHHGQDDGKIEQLAKIEEAESTLFAGFLKKLQTTQETSGTLLDHTTVFYGTNMGNASAHTCDNLPTILAGGGYKHAGHIAYDKKNNKQLSNLFVRMLKQLDVPADKFGASDGIISEI